MREKDERVRVITEILGGIKVLKLYAWEGSFTHKIDGLRDKEIRYLKIMQARKDALVKVLLSLIHITVQTVYRLGLRWLRYNAINGLYTVLHVDRGVVIIVK